MQRPVLYYTFGNHMHWVDMQWLWGYDVLPGSVDDMLTLIRETGARGNINFDVIGYEKMAAEAPEHLAKLREAVAGGIVEPIGCSYGQPYGLFHGGESNVRQLVMGARSVRRLLGAAPRTFWEEEFYFFPQLPQMLAQCGFEGASLFFQWTWHTPELPREQAPAILWEGADGTRIPTLPRSDLNVHQWPEDFDGLLDKVEGGQGRAGGVAVISQWLELMPSKDWMCRGEVLLPRLRELMNDSRFEVRPRTCGALLAELSPGLGDAPVRKYTQDDVWHGMTLGKNADAHPQASARTESLIRAAEAISATASLLGRPYASWDVYPTWELDEAWRELLAAQHHDNHECEGLCGFVGHHQMARARAAAAEVIGRARALLESRLDSGEEGELLLNPEGWSPEGPDLRGPCPPFGYAVGGGGRAAQSPRPCERRGELACFDLEIGRAEVDVRSGRVRVERGGATLLEGMRITLAGKPALGVRVLEENDEHAVGSLARAGVSVEHRFEQGVVGVRLSASGNGLEVLVEFRDGDSDLPFKPGPGLLNALALEFSIDAEARVICGAPYEAAEAMPVLTAKRKYPEGDWMTSPQWFETVAKPMTASGFVDVCRGDAGVLIAHEGARQWFRDGTSLRVILTAYDPWDERRYGVEGYYAARFMIVPHGTATNSERVRMARACLVDRLIAGARDAAPVGGGTPGADDRVPSAFGPLAVENAPGVLAHAFFRESMKVGEHFPDWAGHRMFRESGEACTHPFVVRLVEWNGEPAEVVLKLAGDVAMAAKTSVMGEVWNDGAPTGDRNGGWSKDDTGWLEVRQAEPPAWARARPALKLRGKEITWSEVRFSMRPREIATIYADMVMGRKQFRDLDAKRKVWATIHKTET